MSDTTALTKLFSTAVLDTDETVTKSVRETEGGGTLIRMVASTGAMDRDGEFVEPEGWTIPSPLPKLLWGHNSFDVEAVIGKLTRVWVEKDRLMVEAELADNVEGHTQAKLVAGLVRGGFVNQGSVGFMPLEWKTPDGSTFTRESPGGYGVAGLRFTKQELLEFSLCPVPSQRQSLLEGVKSMFGFTPDELVTAPARITIQRANGDTTATFHVTTSGTGTYTATPLTHAATSTGTPLPDESPAPFDFSKWLFPQDEGAPLSRAENDRTNKGETDRDGWDALFESAKRAEA